MAFFSKKNIKSMLAKTFLSFDGNRFDQSWVLTYHKIVPSREGKCNLWAYQTCADFEKQIGFLKEAGFNFLSLDRFLNGVKSKRLPPRSVLFTLDDGSVDNYEFAFPILKKHRIPAVIFLAAGFVGTNRIFWWDRLESWISKNVSGIKAQIDTFAKMERALKLGDIDLESKLAGYNVPLERSALNWEEIAEMKAEGMSFGAHSVNHIDLGRVSNETAFLEIEGSKRSLEEKTSSRIKVFAYPYGETHNYTEKHFDMLRQLGYEAAFSMVPGPVDSLASHFNIRRVAVSGSDDFWVFKAKLTSVYPVFAEKLRRMEKYVPLPF